MRHSGRGHRTALAVGILVALAALAPRAHAAQGFALLVIESILSESSGSRFGLPALPVATPPMAVGRGGALTVLAANRLP